MQYLNRLKRLYLGLSILFLTLGIGNIAFGKYKKDEHLQILSEAQARVTIPELQGEPFSKPILERYVNLGRQSQQIERVKSRVSFYEFVVLGGKVLLALGGVLLLAWLATTEEKAAAENIPISPT